MIHVWAGWLYKSQSIDQLVCNLLGFFRACNTDNFILMGRGERRPAVGIQNHSGKDSTIHNECVDEEIRFLNSVTIECLFP